MSESKTCFFSGHRQLFLPGHELYYPQGGAKRQWEFLDRILSLLLMCFWEDGIRYFVCGGAMGFDTLAARAVLHLRESGKYPGMELHLCLPCRDQDKGWPEEDRRTYRDILDRADRVDCLQDSYTQGCMLRRDREMADRSAMGIFYYDGRKEGGTAYTYRYFSAKEKAHLRNLYLIEYIMVCFGYHEGDGDTMGAGSRGEGEPPPPPAGKGGLDALRIR